MQFIKKIKFSSKPTLYLVDFKYQNKILIITHISVDTGTDNLFLSPFIQII